MVTDNIYVTLVILEVRERRGDFFFAMRCMWASETVLPHVHMCMVVVLFCTLTKTEECGFKVEVWW